MIYKVENFLFSFFQNMFFGQNLTVEKWGGRLDFFTSMYHGVAAHFFWFFSKKVVIMYYVENRLFLKIEFPMGWRIIFFVFFQKKLSLCTRGKIDFFWKMDFQWDGGSFFFVFFQKKSSSYTMGKYTFFWSMGFPMGWTNFFCVNLFRGKFAICTMGKTCIFYVRVVFVRFHIRNNILINFM